MKDMTAETPLATHVAGVADDGPTESVRTVPSEPFDVEPPYDAVAADLPRDR